MADTKDEKLDMLLKDIEGKSFPNRMNLALYMCVMMYKMHNTPTSVDDFEQVWKAGIKAHKAACGSDFLEHIVKVFLSQGKTVISINDLARIAVACEAEGRKIAIEFDATMTKYISTDLQKRAEAAKGGAA